MTLEGIMKKEESTMSTEEKKKKSTISELRITFYLVNRTEDLSLEDSETALKKEVKSQSIQEFFKTNK